MGPEFQERCGGTSNLERTRIYQVQEAASNKALSGQLTAFASRVYLQYPKPLGLHSVGVMLWGSNRQGVGYFCDLKTHQHLTWANWSREMLSWSVIPYASLTEFPWLYKWPHLGHRLAKETLGKGLSQSHYLACIPPSSPLPPLLFLHV